MKKMVKATASIGAVAVALLTFASVGSSFHTNVGRHPLRLRPGCELSQPSPNANLPAAPRGDVSVGLFRRLLRKNKGEDEGTEGGDGKESDEKTEDEEATPFFATQYLDSLEGKEKGSDAEATPIKSEMEQSPAPVQEAVLEIAKAEKEEELSPLSQAEKLRAQAARIRLEADKRQVELTLEKIAKLSAKLERVKKQDKADTKDQRSLEEELQRLKAQLVTDEKGEVKPVAVSIVAKAEPEAADAAASTASATPSEKANVTVLSRPSLSSEEMERRVERFQRAPEFMKVLVAKTLGFGVDGDTPGAVDRLNATEIVQKLYDDGMDYESIAVESDFANDTDKENARKIIERAYEKSEGDSDAPVFTEEQIQKKLKELDEVPKFLMNIVTNNLMNETELAKSLLEGEWQEEQERKKSGGGIFGLFGSESEEKGRIGIDGDNTKRDTPGTFSRLFSDDEDENSGPEQDLSFMMESLYPKSTRKEDETPDKRQVDAFLNDVVAPTRAFTPSSNPIKVPGGWIIRGRSECDSGDEVIEKLDRRIANDARLRESISVFLLKDPFPNTDDERIQLDPLNWPQVLFVAGPDVAREPAFILRTFISAFGIATVWYGSIYPFLANPKLLEKATEQMELADAGMPTDLSWLSEMSIPLFLSFLALQFVHEIAHQAVAKSKNFEANIPTLVPSVMSGITNAITSLKTSPKNKQDLIDFAVAGPLAGMIGSILVLCYGLILTATADAATVQSFPGLPLVILRQSSLGGGLIDLFLGNGVLNVPSSAEGAQALASTLIALHPFAVAGFFSLIVNALALVPAGRTDGGRISMALFGRSGTQAISFVSLAALFLLGISQSDLLLFYFGYLVFFQTELEIPMRNEVDDVDISRVLLASFAGFLMLLTLIPM